ncbi:hypothetical protein [Microcoleus sp. PH2017_35_SFW_U_B]|nr:hypothetical protein [Microcoleus sp. PH2017_35_SFW_U_B]
MSVRSPDDRYDRLMVGSIASTESLYDRLIIGMIESMTWRSTD